MRLGERVALRDGETVAWLAVIPCALLLVALYLLGPSVGGVLYRPMDLSRVWEFQRDLITPEPTEQARYLLSLVVPVALAATVALILWRGPGVPKRVIAVGVPLAQVGMALLVVACVVAQYRLLYGPPGRPIATQRYFTPPSLAVGAAIALAIAAALRSPSMRRRASVAMRETPAWRIGTFVVAAVFTACWMLHAVNSDGSIAWAHPGVWVNLPYTMDEAFAVVNGRTPLVDFTALYSSLWPFVEAVPLIVIAKSLLVFTLTMCAMTTVALLAIFGVLRRVTRNSLAAMLLYLPFVATSLFIVEGTPSRSYTPGTYFADFPLRYCGPYLMAWFLARRLDGEQRRATWPLFAVAGLVVVDNSGFGTCAFGATLAALLWTRADLRARTLLLLARDVAVGLALAIAAVCALTLARTGTLPQFGRLLTYPRIFAAGALSSPLRGALGLHVIFYMTYLAAIATATVRAWRSEPNRVLTGMLVWSGVFGLGTLAYYVIETGALQLKATFSAWALSLALLTVVAVRSLVANRERWPTVAQLAVLLGMGVMVCSLAQIPTPWSQLDRLTAQQHATPPIAEDPLPYVPNATTRDFMASLAYGRREFYVKHGAPVVLLVTNGHRIADAFGVVNVSPLTEVYDVFTHEQMREVVDALRDAGGNTLVMSVEASVRPDMYAAMVRWGFGVVTSSGVRRAAGAQPLVQNVLATPVMKWVDLRNLHPRALQRDRGTLVARS